MDHFSLIINGKAASTTERFEVLNPSTGAAVGRAPKASPACSVPPLPVFCRLVAAKLDSVHCSWDCARPRFTFASVRPSSQL
jgi:hypothetical protein